MTRVGAVGIRGAPGEGTLTDTKSTAAATRLGCLVVATAVAIRDRESPTDGDQQAAKVPVFRHATAVDQAVARVSRQLGDS